jgi:hypothetical protein
VDIQPNSAIKGHGLGALQGEQGEQNLFETWTRRILFGATLLLCLLSGLANAQVAPSGLSDGASQTALADQSSL